MKIAVTGASGYIGTKFIQSAIKHGHEILALSRKPPNFFGSTWVSYDITSNQYPKIPNDVDFIVHLAIQNLAVNGVDESRDLAAAENLIVNSKKWGINFLFISSQTARPDAPTFYGMSKWQIEQKVLKMGGTVIRPGQVYGGVERGSFGGLTAIVRKSSLMPAFYPRPMIQPIHVDDLIVGMLTVIEDSNYHGSLYSLGSHTPVLFTTFIKSIAELWLKKSIVFFPFPVFLVKISLKFVSSKSNLHRLSSLFELPAMKTQDDLKKLGLSLRSLECGMHPSGKISRRSLLLEGGAFFRYIMKLSSNHVSIRSYVRVIEALRSDKPLGFTGAVIRFPFLIFFIDTFARLKRIDQFREFSWRLGAMVMIAEASPIGAQRFLGTNEDSTSFLVSLFRISKAVIYDVVLRLFVLIAHPAITLFLKLLISK
jgi:NADH dehydrogenase